MPASIRVLIGSEHAPARRLLKGLLRGEPGVTVAGEASNATEAIALSRELKPDIVLLDFHLPYSIGMDSVRLSRIGGLDAAQAIDNELPGVRVVLVNNLDAVVQLGNGARRRAVARLLADRGGTRRPLAMRELCFEQAHPGGPLFVNVEVPAAVPAAKRRRALRLLGGVVLSLIGVWMIAGTVLFALFIATLLAR